MLQAESMHMHFATTATAATTAATATTANIATHCYYTACSSVHGNVVVL